MNPMVSPLDLVVYIKVSWLARCPVDGDVLVGPEGSPYGGAHGRQAKCLRHRTFGAPPIDDHDVFRDLLECELPVLRI